MKERPPRIKSQRYVEWAVPRKRLCIWKYRSMWMVEAPHEPQNATLHTTHALAIQYAHQIASECR